VVRYIGITGNIARRTAEWARNPIVSRTIKEFKGLYNVTRKQARALEHLLIEQFGRISKADGVLENINRGIDPRKLGKYADELAWARQQLPLLLKQLPPY
jgi:uncharacterized protein (UPF0216 family)